MNISWLPSPTQRLHAAVRSKATWGYVIYRTTYTLESNTAFSRIVDVLSSYIKHELFSEYDSIRKNNLVGTEPTPYHEIWSHYLPVIMSDPARFDGASIDSIRAHFLSWVDTQEKGDHTTLYRTCIVIDEESMQAFLDAPLPEKLESDKMRIHPIRYVKVITASPEIDKYDSFMGGEYPGESSDRTDYHPISRGKKIAALLESDDDEYDSFLGG